MLVGASGACGSGCWVTGLSRSLLSDAGSASVDEGLTSSLAGQTSIRDLVRKGKCHEQTEHDRVAVEEVRKNETFDLGICKVSRIHSLFLSRYLHSGYICFIEEGLRTKDVL